MREIKQASGQPGSRDHCVLLLNQIGNNFGFSIAESNELAVSVFEENGTAEYELELARRMVYQCVHKISSRIFCESTPAAFSEEGVPVYHPKSIQLSKIPLSFRAVYILFHVIGFSENEIAYILNINTCQVKERLGKAATKIAAH